MREAALKIVKKLQEAGHVAYFAGGGVRDQLLQRQPKDIDVATSAKPDEVQTLFPRVTGFEGKSFGVVRVIMDDQAIEVATFRKDGRYSDGRHPDNIEFSNAEDDARRRDFTINGLFFDPVENNLIDFVNGQEDIDSLTIRAIGNAKERFTEDKLRLLRAVRFASTLRHNDKPFAIAPETWNAIIEMAPEISVIAPERIRDELDKILTSPKPEIGLDLLDRSGLLKAILPEIDALHGVAQPPQFHPEGDVFTHVRLMFSHLHNPPLPLALGVLFHDVAKAVTKTIDSTGRIRFNGHETVGARMTERIMHRLRYSNEMIDTVVALVENHMTFKDVTRMKVSTLKRFLARPHLQLELELHRVDCLSSHGDISNYHFLNQQNEQMTPEEIRPPRLITGRDLLDMGLKPGKEVGEILARIEESQLEGTVTTREEAIKMAKKLAANPI